MGLISCRCTSCGQPLEISDTATGKLICPYCGSLYLVEEAVKIANNGTININNFNGANVVINQNTNEINVEQYLENARKAKSKEDWEEVERYYKIVEQNEPTNIEAIFYSAYGKARRLMIDKDFLKKQEAVNVFCKSISLIGDNYDVSKSEENKKLIANMNKDLFDMYEMSFVYIEGTYTKTVCLFLDIAQAFINSLEKIVKVDNQVIYLKMIFAHCAYISNNDSFTTYFRSYYETTALSIADKIREIDNTFVVHEEDLNKPRKIEIKKEEEKKREREKEEQVENKIKKVKKGVGIFFAILCGIALILTIIATAL